jgi:hypothetical protein
MIVPLSMIRLSSARRRRGLTRDVLRTSVSVAGQPSQRAGWGATAQAGGGLPAAVCRPGRPSCRWWGSFVVGFLTGLQHCATITSGRRYGTISDG